MKKYTEREDIITFLLALSAGPGPKEASLWDPKILDALCKTFVRLAGDIARGDHTGLAQASHERGMAEGMLDENGDPTQKLKDLLQEKGLSYEGGAFLSSVGAVNDEKDPVEAQKKRLMDILKKQGLFVVDAQGSNKALN